MSGHSLERYDFVEQFGIGLQSYANALNSGDKGLEVPEDYYERPLEGKLDKIFRSSFMLSNGSPYLQILLQASGIRILGHIHDDADGVKSVAAEYTPDYRKFYPPKTHAQLDEDLQARAKKIWDVFKAIAVSYPEFEDVPPNDEVSKEQWRFMKTGVDLEYLHFDLISEMLGRDLFYLTNGRPATGMMRRKRSSIFNDYILGNKPCGSFELDVSNLMTLESLRYLYSSENLFPFTPKILNTDRKLRLLIRLLGDDYSDPTAAIPAELVGGDRSHSPLDKTTEGYGWMLGTA